MSSILNYFTSHPALSVALIFGLLVILFLLSVAHLIGNLYRLIVAITVLCGTAVFLANGGIQTIADLNKAVHDIQESSGMNVGGIEASAKSLQKRITREDSNSASFIAVDTKGTAIQDVFPTKDSVFSRGSELSAGKTEMVWGKGATLPQGVLRGTSLVDSDDRLNSLYKAVQGALSAAEMSALRDEQRQWIKDRDTAVKSALSKAGISSASKEGKNLTDQVMLKWTLQRCEVLEAMAK
jgi:hypothetical protein